MSDQWNCSLTFWILRYKVLQDKEVKKRSLISFLPICSYKDSYEQYEKVIVLCSLNSWKIRIKMQEGSSFRERLMPFRLNSFNWTQRSAEQRINLLLKVNFLFLFISFHFYPDALLYYQPLWYTPAIDNVNRHNEIKMVS